ncbi:MAG: DUF1580 domain-containing protein [Thermoguttaceae bacterium]
MVKHTIPTFPELLMEELVPIQKSGGKFPYPVGRKAIERFIRNGVRGVRLETALIGNRRFTSTQAIERFLRTSNKLPGENLKLARMSEWDLAETKKQLGIR